MTAAGRAWPASFRASTQSERGVVKVVVHVDGGARGNPGPAAAGAVFSTPGGDVLAEAAGVRVSGQGAELSELSEPEQAANAVADERGRLVLAA